MPERCPYFECFLWLLDLATGFPMPECLYCHLVLLLNGGVPSGVSCSYDVEDVLALELEESVDDPGTTIGTKFSVLH